MPGEQWVVVYDAPDGGTYAYTTVYDEHESVRQRARCSWTHGNARTIRAKVAAKRGLRGTA